MAEKIRIALSIGEVSGDEHAAALVAALKRFLPDSEYRGMGGRTLRAAGVETVVDSEHSASVMGFDELLGSAGKILKAFFAMKALLRSWKPNLLIVLDYPEFNLRLSKYANKLGIPVLYYIPPQLWAWRSGRVQVIDRIVAKAALIFPFEKEFYEKRGCARAVFIGHPFSDTLANNPPKKEFRSKFLSSIEFDPESPTVALFPGSRRLEVERHLKVMLQGLDLFRQKYPNVQGIVSLPASLRGVLSSAVEKEIQQRATYVKIINGSSLAVLRACDCGILKSGTSNLQAAFLELPFAMFYIATRFSELIVRTFVKVKEYSIVNVLRPGTVKELLQREATPENVSEELERLLLNSEYQKGIRAGLKEIVQVLSSYEQDPTFVGCKSASERAAKLALDILQQKQVGLKVTTELSPAKENLIRSEKAPQQFSIVDCQKTAAP